MAPPQPNPTIPCPATPAAEFYEQKAAKLGQDPLREDADPEEAWRRVSASKKPIG